MEKLFVSFDFVDFFQAHGVTHFFFDEAHKYPDWQVQIKNVYDYFPWLHLVVSGSSLLKLQIESADLSRRKREYDLLGLSFREFLKFEDVASLPVLTLEKILTDHESIAAEIVSQVKVLPYFENYLKYGYYPFYREEGDGFELRLQNVVEETVCVDIPAVSDIEYASASRADRRVILCGLIGCTMVHPYRWTILSGPLRPQRLRRRPYIDSLKRPVDFDEKYERRKTRKI